ncbi:hypothetical protein BRADI_2g10575v3 [Brachypodium distachyon]|uniref:Uncharacterized protein n=1 Tax=Brachypodium distachyon TaxID=15368 RepID=A0A2K2D7S9_BRADI|nr:hypothetical protein BRADI_2g10575v3 [Brachypodium distachyon]
MSTSSRLTICSYKPCRITDYKIYEEARKSMYQTGIVRSCIWKIFGAGNAILAELLF